ncbi:MAG TPA: hypothetical protein VMU06_01745 [Stellaceae bacterium]|nr:hypothetical protein [Stellaceae bacterium]
MSISENGGGATEFDRWLRAEFREGGAFTALVVLVEIAGVRVNTLCSTYVHVIGDEADWGEIVVLFAGSGVNWDGAAFFPERGPHAGPLDNPTARLRLKALEGRLDLDRLVLNEGHFFDKWGRRMRIEEVERS